MESDQDIKQDANVSVNYENLHGNMNLGNNNEEQKFIEKIEPDALPTPETETSGPPEGTNVTGIDDMKNIAKEIITKVVDGAADLVEKEEGWLDILGNGLLKKKVIVAGAGVDSRPKREQEVTVRYETSLQDGTLVECEESRAFVLSDQDVVDAIDLSVTLMEKGERAIINSNSKYAYGEKGQPPLIPPNSDLIYEIELLDVQEGPYNPSTDLEKRLVWADRKRQKGNKYYSEGQYPEATQTYTRCTKVLEQAWMNEEDKERKKRINALRLKCYNNLAASHMKQENWKDAMKSCRAAEKLEPENVKALFRKGKVHVMLGELEHGARALAKAHKLDPDNKTVALELAKQNRRLEQQKEAQKKMYRRMMGTDESKKPEEAEKRSMWVPSWGQMIGGTLALGAILLGVYAAQKGF